MNASPSLSAAALEKAAKERAQWLYDHGAPPEWVIMTNEEMDRIGGEMAALHWDLSEERSLRHSLVEAIKRLAAIGKTLNVAGLHYPIKDALEIVRESEERDAKAAARQRGHA